MSSTGARQVGLTLAALALSLLLTLGGLVGVALAATLGIVPASAGGGQGASVVTVTSTSSPAGLTVADVDAIAHATPEAVLVSRVVSGATPAIASDALPHASIEGVDPSYPGVWGATLARGSFFTDQNASAANRVAVLGQALASSLFPNGQAPIGTTIQIQNQPFTIVGVLAAESSSGAANVDNTVFVPFQTGQVRLFGTRSAYELLLQVRDAGQASAVGDRVRQLLRQRHRLGAGQPDDFSIRIDALDARDSGQLVRQTLMQAVQLADQFTCRAKALCVPAP